VTGIPRNLADARPTGIRDRRCDEIAPLASRTVGSMPCVRPPVRNARGETGVPVLPVASREPDEEGRQQERNPLRLSTRNQLPGTVADVKHGEIMSSVKVTLNGGDTITAAITR
jgi:hypothetical protein